MSRLTLRLASEPWGTVLTATGELDVATAPELKGELASLLSEGKSVVVDLTAVTFLDSRGIGALVGATRGAREAGGDLAVVATAESHLQSIRILKLDDYLSIAPDLASARALLAPGAGEDAPD
jgi:anti-sigma B factor antagonist